MDGNRLFIAGAKGLTYGRYRAGSAFVPEIFPVANGLCYLVRDAAHAMLFATGKGELYGFDLSLFAPQKRFEVPSHGNVSCHLALTVAGDRIFCANYLSGDVSGFALTDGSPAFLGNVTGKGKLGNNALRQEAPHPHCCLVSDDGKKLFFTDLGQDAIFAFALDERKAATPFCQFLPGTGPRHLLAAPEGDSLYCVSELSCELFQIAATDGRICRQISVTPVGGELSALRLSPDQKTVGVASRKMQKIFFFDRETLALQNVLENAGCWIRDFIFLPDGGIVVCDQKGDWVIFFDLSHNVLQEMQVASPMCAILV